MSGYPITFESSFAIRILLTVGDLPMENFLRLGIDRKRWITYISNIIPLEFFMTVSLVFSQPHRIYNEKPIGGDNDYKKDQPIGGQGYCYIELNRGFGNIRSLM